MIPSADENMPRLRFENRWVVVTGASSGLGLEIARRLALVERANLIVAARRGDRLAGLKQEIEQRGETKVEPIEVDLSRPDGADTLFQRSTAIGQVYGVVNNAGVTAYGATTRDQLESYDRIIDVNLRSAMRLTLLFLDYLLERGEGGIQNVTSVAAFIPVPYQSIYSASKHALQCFTEALHAENRGRGIAICSFAPGGIATDMLTDSGLDRKFDRDSRLNMRPERAARKAVAAFKKGKAVAVPGLSNRLVVVLSRLLPRRLLLRLAAHAYRPPGS